ncbi:hypothetical protein WG902_16250 [Ramlibacter sp. PS3R-8]|uniref:hypothetical protein n=1 Tax=Ramlibacter sp. PS3R-8 TaxID=3133437 RepID=UPI0030AADEB5
MDKTFARKAGAALLLAWVASNAPAQRLDPHPPLRPGSVWVNSVQNSGSFGSGEGEVQSMLVEKNWDGRQFLGIQSTEGTLLIHPAGGQWVGLMGADGQIAVVWDPPLAWEYPVEVGKSWTRNFQVKFPAEGRSVPVEGRQMVEAYEDVTVPAGTFKAYRFRWTDSTGTINTDWYSPDVQLFVKRIQERSAQYPQGPGRRETMLKSYNVLKQ